jgi:O-antigen/teichoic acid export membrane protein
MTTTALPPVTDAAAERRPQLIEPSATGIRITADRLRVWGIRSALSVFDQGLTAAVGFGVNVLLARWLLPDAYGAFAIAFAGFLFIAGFHNVLLLEPLTVMGPSGHAKRLPLYFREQLALHALFVGALSAVILLAGLVLWRITPESPLVGAVMGSGLALPFVLLLWLVRRMCYVLQRPSTAVLGSTFCSLFVFGGLSALRHFGRITPFSAFALMGVGSLLAASVLLLQLKLQPIEKTFPRRPILSREVLREDWLYGRWLLGSAILYSVSSQAQMFLVAAWLGLGAAGILRAMQIPALAMTQVIAATGLLVLPAFSYDFGRETTARMRHKAMLVSGSIGGAAIAFAALLVPFAGITEHLLFGGKYAAYASLIPLLALVPAAIGASIGYSMALRASQRPHFDLAANAVAAPVGIISAAVFIHWWGLVGAAASMVLSFAAYTVVTYWAYYGTGCGYFRD